MEILRDIGVAEKKYKVIKNLYWAQKACVKINGEETGWQAVRRGVRQGCVLSPDLFSLYGEIIMRGISEYEGIRMGGRNINNIRYADDTVLIAHSSQQLQLIFNRVKEESERKGLNINIGKTKTMALPKNSPAPRFQLRCGELRVEQVERFEYLGSIITEDVRCNEEINRRIMIAKAAFINMKSILTNKKLSIKTRKYLVKTYVWPTL